MSRRLPQLAAMLFGALVVALPELARACSTCYGDPGDPLVQGAKAGVLFLGGVVYFQIMLMGGVAAVWMARARRAAQETSDALESGSAGELTPPDLDSKSE